MNILANGNVAQRNKIFLKAQPVCFPGVLTSRDEGFAKGCRGCRDCMGSGGWGSGKWGINCKARHELKTRLGGGGELCSRVRGYGARHFQAASSVDGRRLPDLKGGGGGADFWRVWRLRSVASSASLTAHMYIFTTQVWKFWEEISTPGMK